MTRTSPPKTRTEAGGFSLIELLVVIALIAVISILAVPTISGYFQVSIGAATRELAGTIKETYNSTVMTGNVHRIVYDFKESKYWVESGPPTALMDTKESLEKEERRKKFATLKEREEAPVSPFKLEKSVTRKKVSLPAGVAFEDITTQQGGEPITEGVAYTHFFPSGPTEQTVIHLADQSKHKATLVISPLIGRTDLYEYYITAADIFGK